MTSKVKAVEADLTVKRYAIAYPASEYTFPHQAAIHDVRFDDSHIHLDLTDGRILSIPLWWIPTVYNAPAEDRLKFEISRSRTMIIWDPDKGSINDELRLEDYLGPRRE
ncbi:MAG: DUF2442 domain-containing protein [Candidatus Promineofilum sp.]|jgi:hypothetical protein|nr:DUF2442 domain-containing protein [Promineifilum sp.]